MFHPLAGRREDYSGRFFDWSFIPAPTKTFKWKDHIFILVEDEGQSVFMEYEPGGRYKEVNQGSLLHDELLIFLVSQKMGI